MKRRIYLLVLTFGFIFLSGSAVPIFGSCTCLEPQPTFCESYGTANPVFVGEVVEGSNPDIAPGSVPPSERAPNRFVFKVKKSFAGAEEGTNVQILTGNGDCAVSFRKGATYLVFAYQSGSTLHTTVCSPTRRFTDAAAADNFDEIQSLLKADGAQIYGSVDFWAKLSGAKDANQPLANFNLQIEQTDGAKKKYALTTNSDGKYQLANLPAGKYKIIPAMPAGLKIGSLRTREFSLNEKGCARKDLYFFNDSFIKGRVIDADEKAVVGIPVNLIPAELMPPDFVFKPGFEEYRAGSGFSVANGEFTYNSVPPGKYYLAANFNYLPSAKYPYPTTFYKAPGEKSAATIIEIGLGQKLENIVIRLAPPLATAEVRGKVFWRFGRPAANVFVYIQDAANNQFISTTRTDKDGSFVLQGFTGRKYVISAHAGRNFEIMNFELKAPDKEFVLDDKTGEFKLVLEKNPDFKTN